MSAALISCLSLSSCFGLNTISKITFSSSSKSAILASTYPPGSTAGIKTIAQLGPSVAAVTNVPFNTGLMPSYNIIAPWLSVDGNATSMNSSMLMAITQFNAVACKQMLTSDSLIADGSRWADNGVDFNAGPGGLATGGVSSPVLVRHPTAGSPASGVSAIEQYTSRFWKRAATDDEFNDFATALQNAIKDSTNFSTSTSAKDKTIGVLLVPCTMALSSPAFLLN
jgi:hypothetical protein